MDTRNALIPALIPLMLSACFALLPGCGGSEHQSTEEFLSAVKTSGKTGEDGGGTMPPLGESMDQIAQIRLETQDMDLGVVANDKIHHARLKVFNDGKMPLKITQIDTTCACTMGNVTPERAVVPGGGESWIDVTLDPKRVPGFSSHKTLTITSTDPVRPMVTVEVRASIDPEYFIDAEDVVFGDIPKGESRERRVRFRQIQEKPIKVEAIEVLTLGVTAPKIPGITATVQEIPEAEWQAPGKREYDIVVTAGPEIPAGAFERDMVLVTDTERFKKQLVRALGTVIAPYTVTPVYPARLTLGAAAGGEFTSRATFSAASPITLLNPQSSNPIVKAEVVPGETPNEAYVALRVAAGDMPNQLLDETVQVQVTVDGKTFTEIVGVRNGTVTDEEAEAHAH